MKNHGKNLFIWMFIFLTLTFTYQLLSSDYVAGAESKLVFSDFISKIEEGKIKNVTIQGNYIRGNFQDGSKFSTYSVQYPEIYEKMKNQGVKIEILPLETKFSSFLGIFFSWLPLIFITLLLFYFFRQMNGSNSKAMGFGKSKAKLLSENGVKVTFADVAGIDEAREELIEIVDFLKNPAKFQAIGGTIPKGCLLIGSPGTGKTLLARAIAGEANVPFFSISGSDFVEMFVGVGASRVRDMFEQGKKNAPCIIFIDEIDAVGRNRGIGLGGGNDEREQTLNQLLVEMDGFESNEGVIIVAATNRPDVLDPALLRPGRFDRQIVVPMPDVNGREAILNVHLRKIQKSPGIDAKIIARGTPGFSGAELKNIVNEAALIAARKNMKVITMHELEEAKDKVMMGSERKSLKMDEEERKLTAYHEGGHAILALHQPASDPIHKATIIPRGQALGMVMRLPKGDQFSVTREKLLADLAVAMGGRVAEEIIFGYDKITTGASSDIKQATKIARSMVSEWGMSDRIGTVYHGGDNQDLYLNSGSGSKPKSTTTANIIDEEVKIIVENAYNTAKNILTENLNQLHLLAKALLEYETLSGQEIKDVVAKKKIRSEKTKKNKKTISSFPTMPNTDK